jgi:Xaa-Pro aminopeptidase
MKSDMDRLMAARDLQAIIVTGGEHPNMARQYLANGVDTHGGTVIKKRGDAPVLIVSAMEVDEAAKSGLTVHSYYDLGYAELIEKAEGNRTKADIALWGRYIERFAIPPGKIGIYGTGDIHVYLEFTRLLAEAYPDYQFVGEMGMTLFDEAYVTKDPNELGQIQQVAAATSAVLQATWDYIGSHGSNGDIVLKADGAPLTIGDIKRFVRRELMDRELEDTDMIFAQGRDSGVPHSRGENSQALKLGHAIVFDLFPRQAGGGYYHDVTRTWCIGYAPEAVKQTYDQVMEAFNVALAAYAEPGQPTHLMQEAVLDYFESKGHPTVRSKPGATEGYVHSLGHGVGLNIHERPSIHHLQKQDTFQQGNFITIEPGLYYPEQGYGVRIEDSFYIDDEGALVSLTPFHKQLVLPLRGDGA